MAVLEILLLFGAIFGLALLAAWLKRTYLP